MLGEDLSESWATSPRNSQAASFRSFAGMVWTSLAGAASGSSSGGIFWFIGLVLNTRVSVQSEAMVKIDPLPKTKVRPIPSDLG
jgi:hypothetical protein